MVASETSSSFFFVVILVKLEVVKSFDECIVTLAEAKCPEWSVLEEAMKAVNAVVCGLVTFQRVRWSDLIVLHGYCCQFKSNM